MRTFTIFLSLLIGLMAFPGWSIDWSRKYYEESKGKKFNGRIEAGLIFQNLTSQLCGDLEDNERISSLNDSGDDENLASLIVMFDMTYDLSEDLEIYLGTPFLDDDRDGLALGFVKTFDNESRLDVSLFGGGGEVWEDPYVLNQKRRETDLGYGGISIEAGNIWGSGFDLQYRYKVIEVDDDVIGNRLSDLERDGETNQVGLRCLTSLTEKSYLLTGIFYQVADMDGEAQSYDGSWVEVSYGYEDNNQSLFVNLTVGEDDYDKSHPMFNKKRAEDYYNGGIVYTRFNFWGNPNMYSRYGIGFHKSDANIEFFDSESVYGGMTVGYVF